MLKFEENLASRVSGALQPMLGVQVTVTASNGLLATLYADDESTVLANPLITDTNGYFGFKAANGEYTLTFAGAQIETSTRKIELYDADDDPPLTLAQAAVASASSRIGFQAAGVGALPRTVENKLSEAISVKDFGAKGDGVTDDSAAFQAAIEHVCGNNPDGVNLQGNAALRIPTGQYLINSLVEYVETTSRKINLRIIGDGTHQSTIMVGANNHDGFLHVGVSGGNEAIFQLSDFTIIANGENNGTALEVFADPVGLSRNRRCIIQNVSVRPNLADGQWFNRGIVANGFYYPLVDSCSVSGPFGGTVSSTAYQDTSPGYYMDVAYDLTDCYDATVQNCFAWSCKIGYDLSNTVEPGSEGGYIHHSGSSRSLRGLVRKTVGREPGFIAAFCHFNYRDAGMDLENLKDVDIISCMIYNENSGQVGTGPSPADIRLAGCQDVTITGCRFQFDTCDPRRVAIWGTNTVSALPIQQHKLRNLYVRGNEFACVNLKHFVKCEEADSPSTNVYVLKQFADNTWKHEAIGVGTISPLSLAVGSAASGWVDHLNGVWSNIVNNVTRWKQDANGRVTLTAVASPGVAVDGGARDFVIEGTGTNVGMSILSPANGAGRVYFGSPASANTGRISYMHDVNRMDFTAGGVTTLRVGNLQLGFFGAAATDKPSISGSRSGNAALTDLLMKLATLGLITNNTTV